jgi:hypothetical protein
MARRWGCLIRGGALTQTMGDEGEDECGGGRRSWGTFYRGSEREGRRPTGWRWC